MSLAPSQWMAGRARFRRLQAARTQRGSSSGLRPWVIPFLYVLNLAAYPLLTFLPGIAGVGSTPISITFRALVVILSILLVIHGVQHHRLQLGRPFFFFLLFWALYLTRLLDNTLIETISLARPTYVYWSFSVGVIIVPCLALFLQPRIKDLDSALIALQVAFLIVGLASLRYGMSAIQTAGRLSGNDTENPITLGHIGAAMVICGAFSLLSGRSSGIGILLRVLNYASMGCGMIVLLLSASRSPLVGLAVVITVWAAASLRSRFSGKKQILVLIFVSVDRKSVV